MSAECLQTSPPTPQNSYPKFQNPMISLPGIYLKLDHFPVKIGLIGGRGGSPNFFLHWNLPICVTWEPKQEFKILRHLLLGFEQRYRFRVVIVRFEQRYRFRVVIVRFRVVIVRFCVVIVGKKWNENSSHYTSAQRRSDQ